MFEYDLCQCGNPDLCVHKENCERARTDLPAGIYTYSNFYNGNKECEYYIPVCKYSIYCLAINGDYDRDGEFDNVIYDTYKEAYEVMHKAEEEHPELLLVIVREEAV